MDVHVEVYSDPVTVVAKPTSAAGGAKYHTLRATAKWASFRSAVLAKATHTVDHRADKDRERAQREAHVQVRTNKGG